MTVRRSFTIERSRSIATANRHRTFACLRSRPGGHLAFDEEDGQSTLAMLDPSFMSTLDPHPALENAVATVWPAFAEMLSEVLGVNAPGVN
jgi:hypothetical protein